MLLYDANSGAINYGQPVNWSSPLTRGLVSWWLTLPNTKGGGKWFDLCGRNHGTLTNMAPATDWVPSTRPGGFGALDCDGVNDSIITPTINHNIGTGDWFFTAWIYSTEARLDYRQVAQNGVFSPGIYLNLSAADKWGIYSGSELASSEVWPRDAWHQMGVGRSGTTVYFFRNAVQDATTRTMAASVSNAVWEFGGNDAANTESACKLDSIRLYNRFIQQPELSAMYRDDLLGHPQMLNRIRRPIPFAPAAAGTDTGVLIGGRLARQMLVGGRLVA